MSFDNSHFRDLVIKGLEPIPENESVARMNDEMHYAESHPNESDSRSVTATSVAGSTMGLIGMSSQPSQIQDDDDEQPNPSVSKFRMIWILIFLFLCIVVGGGTYGIVSSVRTKASSSSLTSSPSPSPAVTDDIFPTESPTLSPSYIPTFSKMYSEEQLKMQLFLQQKVSPKIMDQSSYHFQAWNWLAKEDPENILLNSSDGEIRIIQRFVLTLLYFSMGGTGWISNLFLTEGHECEWWGIVCNKENFWIQSIQMNNTNMIGSLPSELSLLTSLDAITFAENKLNGTIPDSLWNLKSLKLLNLSRNEMTGSLPTQIWSCESLQAVILNENRFSGEFPEVTNNDSKISLFFIAYNNMSGSLPESIWDLSSLTYLFLDHNSFVGNFPQINKGSIPLNVLKMNHNFFENSLPSPEDMPNLGKCRHFPFPLCDSKQPNTKSNLEKVAFHSNRFSSSIPDSWWKSTSLQYLDLSENSLTGTLPTWINMSGLQFLYLNNNSLSGSLPQSLPKSLSQAWFQDNNFTGTISRTMVDDLQDLWWLKLEGNRLSGTMPKKLCDVKNLTVDCSKDSPFLVECECCQNCFG
jgi:Leucine rich repeat